jgi:hypothetical protein
VTRFFDSIIVRRVSDPAQPPGPNALIRQCSNCHLDVWVHSQTVEDTGLEAPLVCWECASVVLPKERPTVFIVATPPEEK